MSIQMSNFGTTKDGKEISLFTITNNNGSVLKVTNMGASIVSIIVPDKKGQLADVILGYDHGENYEKDNGDGHGATVGRNANRITDHCFVLNGKKYELACNDRTFNLHSGPNMYYERLWDAELIDDEEGQGVEFSIESPDGDQGFPGNLSVSVSMVLTEDNSVVIEYNAVSDQDTVLNMTNHSYFNLSGHDSGNCLGMKVWIDAESFTFMEEGVVSTGEIRSVEGTPMDFRQLKTIADEINEDYAPLRRCGGYDHNFCLKTNGEEVDLVAKVVDERSGRVMDIFTDMPGIQMYSGNFISDQVVGKQGTVYHPHEGVAFETQHYPDAINHENFPSPIIRAGEPFNSCTVYHFSVLED